MEIVRVIFFASQRRWRFSEYRRWHSGLRDLEREWDEQELLDPAGAARTAQRLESDFVTLAPEFAALSDRHKQIVGELADLVARAR